MPSLSTSYTMMNQALEAFQTALDVTGNNVSNVNTPGYTRQAVNLGEGASTEFLGSNPYEIGSGVTVESVTQIRNALLDQSMNAAQSGLGQYQSLASALQSVQSLFPEPSAGGISEALSGFFNAWSSLASNPGSSSGQLGVQQAAATLTQAVSSAYQGLQQQAQSAQSQITATFDQIDGLTSQISGLNKEIAAQTAGGDSPNALLDQRAKDVQTLSGLVDIQTSTNSDGSINVYTNGLNLVDQGGSTAFPRNYTPGSSTFSNGSTSITVQSGQLAGLAQAAQQIGDYQNKLDALANTLTSQVNGLYSTGTNAAGQTGQAFFVETNPPGGAAAFALSVAIQADPGQIASGTSGRAGDGGLAQSIADLTSSNLAALGNQTAGDFFTSLVGEIGTATQGANNSSATQTALVQQVQAQQQSVSGVNLDEEMSNMLKFQQSYQSAAKALSVLDQTTEDLIQMVQ